MTRSPPTPTLFPYTTLFRSRYRNAFSTIMELLDRGIIPIINENDTVSVDELTFGDNDMLSARVSGFIHADQDRKSTRLNSSHVAKSYAVFGWKKKIGLKATH